MNIETITGNLKNAYPRIVPGTMLHVDELMNERRLNPITETGEDMRKQSFYTADGNLYTVNRRGEVIWGITREPQNLVLQNIAEAFHQLTQTGNYFPDAIEAQASFEHFDTIRIYVKGLQLALDCREYGHFVVDPKKVKKLNLEQKVTAVRIFGPDQDSFEQNMEMFAQAGKVPKVFVLTPDYVQSELRSNDKKFLARAAWLISLGYDSYFNADNRSIGYDNRVRGVRKKSSNDLISAQECYAALSADPEGAAKALDDQKAAVLADILKIHLTKRGQ